MTNDAADLSVAIFRLNGRLSEFGNGMVRDIGLTTASWQVLGALGSAETPITVAQIARNMGLTRQSVQRTANMIEHRGLVRFLPNPAHARAQLVVLTEEGERALVSAMKRQTGFSDRLTDELGADRIKTVLMTVVELYRAIDALDPAAISRQAAMVDTPAKGRRRTP